MMGEPTKLPPLVIFIIIICNHVRNEVVILASQGLTTVFLAVLHVVLVVLLILAMEQLVFKQVVTSSPIKHKVMTDLEIGSDVHFPKLWILMHRFPKK